MPIRMKIVGGLAIAALISLLFGVFGLISTQMLTNRSDELYVMQGARSNIASVLNAHYAWRQGLTESVLAGAEFSGSLDPRTCALGKWRESENAQNITDPEILSLLGQLDAPHAFIHTEAKNIMGMLQSGDSDGARYGLIENVLPRTMEVITILADMETRYSKLLDEKSMEIVNMGNRITTIIIWLLALTAVAVVIMNWRITESIMRPICTITSAAEAIATGDLDVHVSYRVNDQVGRLVKAVQRLVDSTKTQLSAAEALANGDLTVEIEPRSEKDSMSFALIKMIDNLNDMFGKIRSSAAQVSTGSKQLAGGAQSLAQGSTEQASAVEALSISMGAIADKTKENVNIARDAANLSGVIRGNAEKGSLQMEQMMLAVQEINDASGRIEKVIKVIDDIAFQTNILALNAAVEAARAGSAGKGFAVVAEEVRNLAAKSADAAKDTSGLIENSIGKANLGLNIATETSASLKEIVEGINRSAEIVTQIARSSDEQAGAIAHVNTSIGQVAQVVQQNSATAEESAAASEEMNGQSDMLDQLMSQFKLKNHAYLPLPSDSAAGKPALAPSHSSDALLARDTEEYGKY